MTAAWQASAVAARPPLWDPRLFWLTLVFVAAILLGVLIIHWIDRWRKRSGSERLSANDQLASFRELYDQGQLSQEEFERIRALLFRQLRQEWDVPATAPGTTPEQKQEAQLPLARGAGEERASPFKPPSPPAGGQGGVRGAEPDKPSA